MLFLPYCSFEYFGHTLTDTGDLPVATFGTAYGSTGLESARVDDRHCTNKMPAGCIDSCSHPGTAGRANCHHGLTAGSSPVQACIRARTQLHDRPLAGTSALPGRPQEEENDLGQDATDALQEEVGLGLHRRGFRLPQQSLRHAHRSLEQPAATAVGDMIGERPPAGQRGKPSSQKGPAAIGSAEHLGTAAAEEIGIALVAEGPIAT